MLLPWPTARNNSVACCMRQEPLLSPAIAGLQAAGVVRIWYGNYGKDLAAKPSPDRRPDSGQAASGCIKPHRGVAQEALSQLAGECEHSSRKTGGTASNDDAARGLRLYLAECAPCDTLAPRRLRPGCVSPPPGGAAAASTGRRARTRARSMPARPAPGQEGTGRSCMRRQGSGLRC